MLSNFYTELDYLKWEFGSKTSQSKTNLISIILFGFAPLITILLALNFPNQVSIIYGVGKLFMFICSIQTLKELFRFSSWKTINYKRLGVITSLLAAPPFLFLFFLPHFSIDSSGIEQHLQKFELQHHLIYILSFLCLGNALLEESFFRGFLNHPSIKHRQLKLLNAALFMPHHLIITLVYFPLPLALLFTFATGVAGWAWMHQRLEGAKLPELWISHFILDVIVIAGALISFNLI